jgi:hypothetical protein
MPRPALLRTWTQPETLLEAMGVRLAEGDGGGAPAAPAPAAEPAAPAAPAAPTAPAPTAGEWDGKVESLPPAVQKVITDLRKENGDRRATATQAEAQQQKLIGALQAAGLIPGGEEKPDPAALTERLTASQQQARQAAVELAVFRSAAAAGVDPDAALDSRAFLTKVEGLDPTAADFTTQVTAALTEAATTNPKLKAGRAPGASSVDHSAGGPGEGRAPRKPVPLTAAITGHYSR